MKKLILTFIFTILGANAYGNRIDDQALNEVYTTI